MTLRNEAAAASVGQVVLPVDYDRIFAHRMVLLTGLSRSGTSIVAKLVGSLDGVVYLHEPVLMRYIPPLVELGHLDFALASQTLKGLLFEDFMLQVIQGRYLNLKRSENSFFGHYAEPRTVRARWQRYRRRGDVLRELQTSPCCTFVTKITEMQMMLPLLAKIFEGLKVIHIIRNGNEVVDSSVQRGWFSDEYLNQTFPAWTLTTGATNVPWFIPPEDVEYFTRWNAQTRLAYLWRFLTECAVAYGDGREDYVEIRYEQLMHDPEAVLRRCEAFVGARRTRLTERHLRAVQQHAVTQHADQRPHIDAAELPRFEQLMQRLGYA